MQFSNFKLVLVSGLLAASQVFAAGDTREVLELIANEAKVSNGSADVKAYDVDKFDVSEGVRKLQKAVQGEHRGDCKVKMFVGVRKNIDALKSPEISSDFPTANALERLARRGLIAMIYSAQWDGVSGDGESCSIYNFRVFTTDGYRLDLDYDLTD